MFNYIRKYFKSKQPEIKFVCLIPEVAKAMPIVPASKIHYKWAKKAADDFKQQRDSAGVAGSVRHIARCPGIAKVAKVGWVQRSWQDISIQTDGTGGFGWGTPINQSTMTVGHEFKWDYVSHHSADSIEPFGLIKNGTLPTIVKIQSPWIVYIPKGYYLMCIPIPYSDDPRFTSTIGLLDGDHGPIFLNAQLYWHCLDSQEVIPAGTPLAQYYLIKKEEITEVVSAVTESEVEDLRLRRVVVDSQFMPTYSKLKSTVFNTGE